jgi:hypothetical protein
MERVEKLFGFLQNLSNRMVTYESPIFGELLLSIDNIFKPKCFVKHYLFTIFHININVLVYIKLILPNSYRIYSINYPTSVSVRKTLS